MCSLDGPMNMTISSSITVQVNSSVTLNCSAASLPNATYSWVFNGTNQAAGAVYQIPSVALNQSGEYTCIAINNVTGLNSSARTNLTVIGKKF